MEQNSDTYDLKRKANQHSSQLAQSGSKALSISDNRSNTLVQRKLFDKATQDFSVVSFKPVQRTVYKIASVGPEFHQTDPEKYATMANDQHVQTSLHLSLPDEINLRLSTNPMTIFMHGSTMNSWSADELFDFLKARKYEPKPNSDIVFITCSGALLMDKFLVSKGQALANLLRAKVHLAKGTVRINQSGVPVVDKPNSPDKFDYINSKAELASILQGTSQGWATFIPHDVVYDKLRTEILRVKGILREYSTVGVAAGEANWLLSTLVEMQESLKTDRSKVPQQYSHVLEIEDWINDSYLPALNFYRSLQKTIYELRNLEEETTTHKDRVQRVLSEFEGWSQSIRNGKGDIKGFELLYHEKLQEWVIPLKEAIKQENEVPVSPGNGWDDSELDFDDL